MGVDLTTATLLLVLATGFLAFFSLLQYLQSRGAAGQARQQTTLLARQTEVLARQAEATNASVEELRQQRIADHPLELDIKVVGGGGVSSLALVNTSRTSVMLVDRIVVRQLEPAHTEPLVDAKDPVTIAARSSIAVLGPGLGIDVEHVRRMLLVEVYGRPQDGPDQRREFWLGTGRDGQLRRLDRPEVTGPFMVEV